MMVHLINYCSISRKFRAINLCKDLQLPLNALAGERFSKAQAVCYLRNFLRLGKLGVMKFLALYSCDAVLLTWSNA